MKNLIAALAFTTMLPVHAADQPVYELRIYVCNEGKLPDLLARFRDHTCALFEKHGMTNLGYWTPTAPTDGANTTLIYLLQHASREAANASFAAFGEDPDWQTARIASEANGKILAQKPTSIFLTPTDFSMPLKVEARQPSRTFELRTYTTEPGKLDALHTRFRDHTINLFTKHGMTHIAYWTPMDADQGSSNTLLYLLAHDSEDAAKASFTAFRQDPDWIAAKTASEQAGALTVPDGVKSVMLQPTDFSPMK